MSGFLRWLLGIGAAQAGAAETWRVRFVAEYDSYVRLAMFVALALLAYLTVRNYRREGTAQRSAKAMLACIRIAVIVLVFAVLFRPALVLKLTEAMYSSVVLLIDDSASMSVKDRYSLADRESRARELSEMLKTDVAGLADISRSAVVRKVLLRDGGAVADLAGEHNILVMRFSPPGAGRGSYVETLGMIPAMPRSQWRGSSGGGLAALSSALKGLQGSGTQTDLAAAVTGALRETVGQRISGIAVISDGRITTERDGADLAEAKRRAEDRGIPLCAVSVGDTASLYRNIAVASVRAPSARVRRGSRVTFVVKVVHSRFDGEKITVNLRRRRSNQNNWQEVAHSNVVALEDGGPAAATRPAGDAGLQSAVESQQLVSIDLEPQALGKELGDFIYQAYVRPVHGDVNPDDDAAETSLRICDDKINVLLIGVAGWEFQYLRDFFLRELRPNSEGKNEEAFRITVWQQDADPELNQDASTGMKLRAFPRDLEQLIGSPLGTPFPGYDMVILCDPMAAAGGFDEQFVKLLKKFVQDHGGGLCYIAGRKNTETNLLDNRIFADLAELLPVEVARKSADIPERIRDTRPKAYQVYLTPYGVGHPVTRLEAQGSAASGVWNVLPGLYWSHPVRKSKPLAQVLAVSSSPFRRTAADEPEPVLAVQSSGAGRVLYVGFDGTWRWRYVEDAHYFRTFWRDVVSFLAPLKIHQVSISASKPRYNLAEPVTVEVEAFDDKYQPVTADTYRILLVQAAGQSRQSRKIELRAVDPRTRPGLYAGTIEGLEEGKYEFAPAVPVPEERVETVRIEVVRPQAEARRPEADVTTLRYPTGLASREENFLRIHEIDKLPNLIPSGRLTFAPERTYELLDSKRLAGITLATFVALLAAEWVLRKRQNLA